MNIVVCLKQVPKKDSILRIGPDQKWIDERDISYEMSEADAYALEEALRQKEKHGGEVIVISLGPERVRQSIKEALAKGADRAIHLHDPIFDSATDATAVARALAAALKGEKCDLIFTGLQSDDYGFAQVGLIVAEQLGLPSATIVMEVQPEDGAVRVKRELESGWFNVLRACGGGTSLMPLQSFSAGLFWKSTSKHLNSMKPGSVNIVRNLFEHCAHGAG